MAYRVLAQRNKSYSTPHINDISTARFIIIVIEWNPKYINKRAPRISIGIGISEN